MTFYVSSGRGAPYLIFDLATNPSAVRLTYSQTYPNSLTVKVTLKDGTTVTNTNDAINIPDGKSLCGFSLSNGATTVNIPFNRDVSIPGTTQDIFAVFRDVKKTVTVNLYKNGTESNTVNKSGYLTDVGSLEGTFREGCSVTSPSITFYSISAPAFNYVYISKFSRYYYVTATTNISNNLWRADLKCDVLMSYKNEILNLYCVIARQENAYNDNLIDDKLLQENGETVTYETINNTVLNAQDTDPEAFTSRNYVLVAVGG